MRLGITASTTVPVGGVYTSEHLRPPTNRKPDRPPRFRAKDDILSGKYIISIDPSKYDYREVK